MSQSSNLLWLLTFQDLSCDEGDSEGDGGPSSGSGGDGQTPNNGGGSHVGSVESRQVRATAPTALTVIFARQSECFFHSERGLPTEWPAKYLPEVIVVRANLKNKQ